MRYIILLFLCITSPLAAQLAVDVEFAYYQNYAIGVLTNSNYYIGNGEDVSQLNANPLFLGIDLSYTYWLFKLYGWSDSYMLKGESIYFIPFSAECGIGLEIEYEFITAYIEHMCLHPVYSEQYDGLNLRSSYNKIGVILSF
jgi:hypothetical protein